VAQLRDCDIELSDQRKRNKRALATDFAPDRRGADTASLRREYGRYDNDYRMFRSAFSHQLLDFTKQSADGLVKVRRQSAAPEASLRAGIGSGKQ
jgi:hypothetical protein